MKETKTRNYHLRKRETNKEGRKEGKKQTEKERESADNGLCVLVS
jgi:hypothetical protein